MPGVIQLGDSYKGGIVYHTFVDSGTSYALVAAPVNEIRQDPFNGDGFAERLHMKLYGHYGPSGLLNTSADSTSITNDRSGNTTALYSNSAAGAGTTSTYPLHTLSAMNHIWTNVGDITGMSEVDGSSISNYDNILGPDVGYTPRQDATSWFIPNITQLQKFYDYLNNSSLHDVASEYNRLHVPHKDYTDGYDGIYSIFASSTENPSNQAQQLQAINFGPGQSADDDGDTINILKIDWAMFRAIRIVEIPPAISLIDADGSEINNSNEIIFTDLSQASGTPYTEHSHDIPHTSGNGAHEVYWYSSYIKFTDMIQTNTAAAVFGDLHGIQSVRYTNSSGTNYVYYKSGATPIAPDQALTTLTDGAVYRVHRAATTLSPPDYYSTGAGTITLNGTMVQTSGGSDGFSFAIPSGESYMPWPISEVVNIDDVFGQEGDPDFRRYYKYHISRTADATNAIWGRAGRLTTGKDIGDGEVNTTNIIAFDNTDNIAADICNDLSVTIDGTTYNDWYLPSSGSLDRMYLHKEKIGGFDDANYWSSSTVRDDRAAESLDMGSGTKVEANRTSVYKVRPVRNYQTYDVKEIGDTYQGGVIFASEYTPESKIDYIVDNVGNMWRPNSTDNTLVSFSPGKGYYIVTHSSISFDFTRNNARARNKSVIKNNIQDEWINFNLPDKSPYMTMFMSESVIQAALDLVPEHATFLAYRTDLMDKYIDPSTGDSAIKAFYAARGFTITWNTIFDLNDDYAGTAGVSGRTDFQADWKQIETRIKSRQFKYKIVFDASDASIKGGTLRYRSEFKQRSSDYAFEVKDPDQASNFINFTIFTGNERARISRSRFKYDLTDIISGEKISQANSIEWKAKKKYRLTNPTHVSTSA